MEKKEYSSPEFDLIEFDYREQVVATSGCGSITAEVSGCPSGDYGNAVH